MGSVHNRHSLSEQWRRVRELLGKSFLPVKAQGNAKQAKQQQKLTLLQHQGGNQCCPAVEIGYEGTSERL